MVGAYCDAFTFAAMSPFQPSTSRVRIASTYISPIRLAMRCVSAFSHFSTPAALWMSPESIFRFSSDVAKLANGVFDGARVASPERIRSSSA